MEALKLYQINDAIDRVINRVASEDGVLTPETEAELDALEMRLDEKVEAVALHIRNIEATAKALREEEQRFRTRRVAAEKNAKWLKGYLKRELERRCIDRIDSPLARVAIQKNSRPTITWLGSTETLPRELQHVSVFVRLDSEKALKAHQEGTLPDGFEVVTGTHIRIR